MNSDSLTNLKTAKETILIVDDSPDNLRVLSLMLKSQGYDVKKAISGRFAMQALEVIHPDLILLDINMPEMNGYEICQLLKEKPNVADIPIIFISASHGVLDKVKAFRIGGGDYITKPFHLEEVLIRVENQLTQARLYHALQQQNDQLKTEIDRRCAVEMALLEANHQLSLLASLDGLTGIANRRRFDEYIIAEWQRAMREQHPLSLILIDVDYFKNYNDTYGHLLGDDCLKKIAEILQRMSQRATDLAARYGGEEFVLILPNTSQCGAQKVAQRIKEAIADQTIPHKNSSVSEQVTLSMGIMTVIPNIMMEMADFISRADQALFKAKSEGRDRIVSMNYGEFM
ncbi:MAG: diguanylate cyclase [Snowella sp.]|nr:diguanylate cyclase [Snowella sp.]